MAFRFGQFSWPQLRNALNRVFGTVFVTRESRVGIGTEVPEAPLHVDVGTDSGVIFERHVTGTGGVNLSLRKSRGTAAAPLVVSAGDAVSSIVGYGHNGSSYQPVATVRFEAESVAAGNLGGRVEIETANASGASTPAVAIDEAQQVGVGTFTPGAPLHIHRGGTPITANPDTALLVQDDATTASDVWITIASGTSGTAQVNFGDTDSEFRGRIVFVNASDRLDFYTAGARALSMLSNQRLGAGTLNPAAKLHLDGSADEVQLMVDANGTQTGDVAQIRTSGGTPQIVVDESYQVGVGTSAPGAPLHVHLGGTPVSATAGTAVLAQDTSAAGSDCWVTVLGGTTGTAQVNFGDSGGEFRGRVIYDNTADRLDIYSAGSRGLAMVSSQRIGIQTISPSARLHLDGNVDEVQLIVDANGTQTSDVVQVRNSLNAVQVSVDQDFAISHKGLYSAEIDDGNSGAADTIDFTAGNYHLSTLTASCAYTFTAPSGAAQLVLRLVQGGAGSFAPTLPAAVKWAGGTAPTWSTAVGAVDVVRMYYDGTNYHSDAIIDSK